MTVLNSKHVSTDTVRVHATAGRMPIVKCSVISPYANARLVTMATLRPAASLSDVNQTQNAPTTKLATRVSALTHALSTTPARPTPNVTPRVTELTVDAPQGSWETGTTTAS